MSNETGTTLPLLSQDHILAFQSERNIIIAGTINSEMALKVMMLLRLFDLEQPGKPITLYINSGGGEVIAGLTIIDNMRLLKSPVYTICYGIAASMASVIFACGDKGHRYILPHAEIMIHQPWSGIGDGMKQSEAEVFYKHITRTRDTLEGLLAEQSNISVEQMHIACEQDNYLTAEQAIEMGLADEILK